MGQVHHAPAQTRGAEVSGWADRDRSAGHRDFRQAVDVPLKTFLESRPELLLQGLEHPDPDHRTICAMGLTRLGKDARRWLLHYLRTSDHLVGRSTAVAEWMLALRGCSMRRVPRLGNVLSGTRLPTAYCG